jgi:hypothetical protein
MIRLGVGAVAGFQCVFLDDLNVRTKSRESECILEMNFSWSTDAAENKPYWNL